MGDNYKMDETTDMLRGRSAHSVRAEDLPTRTATLSFSKPLEAICYVLIQQRREDDDRHSAEDEDDPEEHHRGDLLPEEEHPHDDRRQGLHSPEDGGQRRANALDGSHEGEVGDEGRQEG